MFILIFRNAIQQKDAPFSIFFNIVMQAEYPKYCGYSSQCKKVFRQYIINKFLDARPFFLSIPLVNGQIIRFEANVESLVTNYGECNYMTILVVTIIIDTKIEIQKI
jgi:hypothetical protein